MKLAFVVNRVETEGPKYTTNILAHRLHQRGHEVFYFDVGRLDYTLDGRVGGLGHFAPAGDYETPEDYHNAVHGNLEKARPVYTDELDIIFLRNDPGEDAADRNWASNAALMFGQLASQQGTIVVNDPFGLSHALNKMYLQQFPESVRPRTVITRRIDEIRQFAEQEGNDIILKPLLGSGGKNVFVVREDDHPNLNQIVDVISNQGYVIAQEFMPAAAQGDIRLFLMNGEPLVVDGHYAAVHRIGADDDIRNNLHAGGSGQKAEITPEILKMVELIRPKLIADGMFLVGLDIAGDRLLEINLESPGGLRGAGILEGVDFTVPVAEALEKKVLCMQNYGSRIPNRTIATL
ncbi:glutathione synthase [Lewinella marina]|uniref:Glutathione synthetase n=1 Tax=Neolewinella marina TaxID=438751 RepID=A0A2G0CJS2_9BACT|nr:glutathione synthetase [Neolewinella marina]NJB84611.1 glutathione synthase [Neolewinella marina]PHL00212.1 glutathione synthetase [Neolewinella marina]